MAKVVVVVLVWCATADAVVRADEYGGGSMPMYDDSGEYAAAAAQGPGSGHDYRGHSPDAPALLDYKYQEEPQGNSEKSTRNIIKPNSWKRPARKQRGLSRDRDEQPDHNSADSEPLRESKSSWRRNSLHRSHLAGGMNEPARHRRRGRRGRSRDDTDPLPGDFLHGSDQRVNKNQILDEDIDTFTPRDTTEKYVQKKPRNRLLSDLVKPLKSDDLDFEEELIADRKLKSSSSIDSAEKGRGRGGGERGGRRFGERDEYQAMLELPPELPEDEDKDDDVAQRPRGRHKSKEYHDYNDYYGMRKVHNIDSKLPMLVRRTTTRSPLLGEPSSSGTTMDLLALLWTARRAPSVAATFAPAPPASAFLPSDPQQEPTEPPEVITTTTTATAETASIPARTSSGSTLELSIAEKSRLSILKKSQKKENIKGEPSKKPPVLLQVTSKMPTVVMVEPPTSADPWMRARLVSGDSPQKLEKVKRLMRHKLVAGAKSIQDLTDNWDDMVCDYIDVSLLNIAIGHQMSLPLLCVTHMFALAAMR